MVAGGPQHRGEGTWNVGKEQKIITISSIDRKRFKQPVADSNLCLVAVKTIRPWHTRNLVLIHNQVVRELHPLVVIFFCLFRALECASCRMSSLKSSCLKTES